MGFDKHGRRIARGYQVAKCFAGNGRNWGLNGNSGDWKLETGNLNSERRKDGEMGHPDKRRGERLPRTRVKQEKGKVKTPTRKPGVIGHPKFVLRSSVRATRPNMGPPGDEVAGDQDRRKV